MTIGIEGDVDTGVTHLVPNVCRCLAIGDQPAREEVLKIVVSCARHSGALYDWPPDLSLKIVRVNETMAAAAKASAVT